MRNFGCSLQVRFHYNGFMLDPLIIAGREFRSRLIVGTGKYKSFQETARALEASGAEMVTVAVRRVNLDRSQESLLVEASANCTFTDFSMVGDYSNAAVRVLEGGFDRMPAVKQRALDIGCGVPPGFRRRSRLPPFGPGMAIGAAGSRRRPSRVPYRAGHRGSCHKGSALAIWAVRLGM